MTKKQTNKILKEVRNFLTKSGATINFLDPRGFHTWVIQTVNGPLHITPYDDFFALQFRGDLKKVTTLPGGEFNPHSGKWNIHRYDDKGNHLLDQCFDELKRRLEIIKI